MPKKNLNNVFKKMTPVEKARLIVEDAIQVYTGNRSTLSDTNVKVILASLKSDEGAQYNRYLAAEQQIFLKMAELYQFFKELKITLLERDRILWCVYLLEQMTYSLSILNCSGIDKIETVFGILIRKEEA